MREGAGTEATRRGASRLARWSGSRCQSVDLTGVDLTAVGRRADDPAMRQGFVACSHSGAGREAFRGSARWGRVRRRRSASTKLLQTRGERDPAGRPGQVDVQLVDGALVGPTKAPRVQRKTCRAADRYP